MKRQLIAVAKVLGIWLMGAATAGLLTYKPGDIQQSGFWMRADGQQFQIDAMIDGRHLRCGYMTVFAGKDLQTGQNFGRNEMAMCYWVADQ